MPGGRRLKNAMQKRPLHPTSRTPKAARGSFLLEALIAVLIVSLAVLGLVGLISRSMQNIDESKFRGEAAALAASFVGQMWIDDRSTAALKAKYESGAGYDDLKTMVQQRLPNSTDPTVTVVAGATGNSSNVTVTVTWRPPGDTTDHRYQMFAVVGANN